MRHDLRAQAAIGIPNSSTQPGPCKSRNLTAVRYSAALLCAAAFTTFAAVPGPEKLLPSDTLVMVTAPDFPRLKSVFQGLPQAQFWNDPAMKPFRDKFVSKW